MVHHSHTDIGFTHDQPVVWELQARFIDQALNLIERLGDNPPDSRFRWTCESLGVLDFWLRRASSRDIDRLIQAERAGSLEATALFANLTPLHDIVQCLESMQAIHRLRAELGLTITSAMNCDVNGENWPLVELLLDAGVSGFSMAINPVFGGAPEPLPQVFLWEGPSGRRLPAYNGWHYARAGDMGLADADDDRFLDWRARVEQHLAQTGYALPCLMVQGVHPFGDNGGPDAGYADFARRWNATGRAPRIVLATPRQWWQAVQPHLERLPVWRGDWTDYWNFGCISSARETAVHRTSRTRLTNADALFAAGRAAPREPARQGWAERAFADYRAAAWQSLNLWAEHTWGADCAVNAPELEDSVSQQSHKHAYVYQARSLSLLLQRDALADFAQLIPRRAADDLLLFNPLPWPRTLSGRIDSNTLAPRAGAADAIAGRHFQGHRAAPTQFHDNRTANSPGRRQGYLPPTHVPGFGYVTVPRASVAMATPVEDTASVVENERFRLAFDPERGGLASLYDKQTGWEWADPSSVDRLHGFVHESAADRQAFHRTDWSAPPSFSASGAWQPDWPAQRVRPERVLDHRVYRTPAGVSVEQALAHPAAKGLRQRVFLPARGEFIECETEWEMGMEQRPEAGYVLFPFNLPGATVRLNAGGAPMTPGRDQLPGVCRDYFTVQDWLDFSDGQRGVVVAMPENPMVQLGDFHFAQHQAEFRLERPLLLGWVTNNYWATNFQAAQPGRVYARYQLWPYAGAFDEARAHRCGAEAAQAWLLAQHLGEAAAPGAHWPEQGTLLELPADPILTLHVRAGTEPGDIRLRLWNASDMPQEATFRSALLAIRQAQACDVFDQPLRDLAVEAGAVRCELPPRRVCGLRLLVR